MVGMTKSGSDTTATIDDFENDGNQMIRSVVSFANAWLQCVIFVGKMETQSSIRARHTPWISLRAFLAIESPGTIRNTDSNSARAASKFLALRSTHPNA